MTRETLFSWTAPGSNYPRYVNVSRDGEDVIFTIREASGVDGKCGHTSSICIPVDALKEGWPLPSPPGSVERSAAPNKTAPPQVSGKELCEGCPPAGYPTDDTRCTPCPRRTVTRKEPQS